VEYILIVDDNFKNLETTARLLRDEGYGITLAVDAQSALDILEEIVPDLILLDIMMPGMDGFECCRILKSKPKFADIPVIFLSALTDTSDMTEGFKAGGVDYITKPFRSDELIVRVKNHLELAASRKKILEMVKSRDRLYSIIAHDIRAPFSSISFTIDAIANGYIDPAGVHFREIVMQLDRTTTQTHALLENLLTWARISADSMNIYPETVLIQPVLEKCLSLYERSLSTKRINLTLSLGAALSAWCDELTLYTILRNLISNALKFTPEGGLISIHSGEYDGQVRISVRDSGIGMDEAAVSRLMTESDPFTTDGTDHEKGSGLGYVIVRDFLRLNNGKLEVESVPGSGTKVTISIPMRKE
jgi:two-component system sensor histidine kinase/response regulator